MARVIEIQVSDAHPARLQHLIDDAIENPPTKNPMRSTPLSKADMAKTTSVQA
jgi:hypothetical protein